MVCYAVPLVATLAVFISRKLFHKECHEGFWLNIMLLGGGVFGFVDHLWNGELFLLTTGWMTDIALGSVITGGIFASWSVIAYHSRVLGLLDKVNPLSRKQ